MGGGEAGVYNSYTGTEFLKQGRLCVILILPLALRRKGSQLSQSGFSESLCKDCIHVETFGERATVASWEREFMHQAGLF